MFKRGFVEDQSEEGNTFFNSFHIIIFLFSVIILSLISYTILIDFSKNIGDSFYLFINLFTAILFYLLLKWFLEYLFSLLFLIREDVRFFLFSKSSYLYNICFYLFICLFLVQFTKLNVTFLKYVTVLFFLLRFWYHLANNKKLIFNKLFYFILYLCAFEIAPLFILFKLMF